jgi:hypothetical protein
MQSPLSPLRVRVASLLAVDLGVRTGLAYYGADGRLVWYRSQNFGAASRLKRAIPALLSEPGDVTRLVLEGGGPLAQLWRAEAERRDIITTQVSAQDWRSLFLLPREQRSGVEAKRVAGRLARHVIAWSGAPRPTSLRHDTAEAILVGLWGVLSAGWLRRLPPELLR